MAHQTVNRFGAGNQSAGRRLEATETVAVPQQQLHEYG
jgi:hypothetical protein